MRVFGGFCLTASCWHGFCSDCLPFFHLSHTLSATHTHTHTKCLHPRIHWIHCLHLAVAHCALCVPSCLVRRAQCNAERNAQCTDTGRNAHCCAQTHYTTQTHYPLVLEKYRQFEDGGWGWRGGRTGKQSMIFSNSRDSDTAFELLELPNCRWTGLIGRCLCLQMVGGPGQTLWVSDVILSCDLWLWIFPQLQFYWHEFQWNTSARFGRCQAGFEIEVFVKWQCQI